METEAYFYLEHPVILKLINYTEPTEDDYRFAVESLIRRLQDRLDEHTCLEDLFSVETEEVIE